MLLTIGVYVTVCVCVCVYQGLSYLGGEIAEFQHQRKKEMDQFEQYKREEIRKLK